MLRIAGRKVTRTLGVLVGASLGLLLAAGCDLAEPPPQPTTTTTEAPYSAHLALAGGGWRAHSGHAGWTLALLDGGEKTLADVFEHVGTVSSNSGGSWFSTMLVYSPDFVQAIEAKDALASWSKSGPDASGWLGQQQYLFDQASCHWLEGEAFLACVFAAYTGGLENATYWNEVVEDLVFKNFPVGGPLSGARQPWAEGKPLLLAATMLTNEVVLGELDSSNQQFYQACISPAEPVLEGQDGASCSDGSTIDVTPVTFSSLPSGSSSTPPPFFPAIAAGTAHPEINVGYTERQKNPAQAEASLENPVANDQVPVMIAAAASSAALGFGASYAVIKDWSEAYDASDEALNFQLEGTLQHVVANGMTVEQLAAKKIVQIADGGPADNSGVAQLVSFLQSNGQGDGFHIVAFDNVEEIYQPVGSAAPIGTDLAYLFGKGLSPGDEFCSGAHGGGVCVKVPDLQIFELDALTDPSQLTWQAQHGESQSPPEYALVYTRYPVTTVENTTFGVTAGTKGTLHAFTCVWADADTAPQNDTQDGDFKAYAAMLDFISTGLAQSDSSGKTGLDYLHEALGLAP